MLDNSPRPHIALLAHGFNVRDRGVGSIGRLRWFLATRGYDVVNFDLGWMGLLRVRTQNHKHARRMAEAAINAKRLGAEVIAIGHSNGCAIIHLATAEYGAPIDRVAYINPALDSDAAVGLHVKRCTVWHTPSDLPTRISRWLPFHDWGDMGAYGYQGEDPRMTNINMEELPVPITGHSEFSTESNMPFYGPLITERII